MSRPASWCCWLVLPAGAADLAVVRHEPHGHSAIRSLAEGALRNLFTARRRGEAPSTAAAAGGGPAAAPPSQCAGRCCLSTDQETLMMGLVDAAGWLEGGAAERQHDVAREEADGARLVGKERSTSSATRCLVLVHRGGPPPGEPRASSPATSSTVTQGRPGAEPRSMPARWADEEWRAGLAGGGQDPQPRMPHGRGYCGRTCGGGRAGAEAGEGGGRAQASETQASETVGSGSRDADGAARSYGGARGRHTAGPASEDGASLPSRGCLSQASLGPLSGLSRAATRPRAISAHLGP